MNPETNQFEGVPDLNEFKKRFYSKKSDDEVPVFTIYEKIRIKGYFFKVIQIREDRLVLQPVGPAMERKIDMGMEEAPNE